MKPRCILITGANGGIGQAIARYFLENDSDCHVYLGVRSNRDQAEAMVAEFAGRATILSLDVTCEESWTRAIAQVGEAGHTITVLVNNAGHHDDHLLANMPESAWHEVLSANLTSVFLGCQAVTRGMMMERGGRIINVASLSALMAPMGQANYAAAKAGVIGLTQSFSKEVARMGITVNSVYPGYIETGALSGMSPDDLKARKRGVPMRRFGQPREVAAAVFFLASPDAGYIVGAVLKIDGGIF